MEGYHREVHEFCLSLCGATHVVQWGGSDVYKAGGKLFAIAGTDGMRGQTDVVGVNNTIISPSRRAVRNGTLPAHLPCASSLWRRRNCGRRP